MDVDLGVLVLAEVVLQRLEPLHERLARRRRVQPAEALEEVAQLLGVLAQLVEHLGGGRRGDRAAARRSSCGAPAGCAWRRRSPSGTVGAVAHAARLTGSSSHADHVSSDPRGRSPRSARAARRGVLRPRVLVEMVAHRFERRGRVGAERLACTSAHSIW